MVTCGALHWRSEEKGGPVLFSLRPEAIFFAPAAAPPDAVRFRATVNQQLFGGASELLELDCGGGQSVRARIPARGPLSGEHEFIFSASDAIRVRGDVRE
jgi:hypothetical protein